MLAFVSAIGAGVLWLSNGGSVAIPDAIRTPWLVSQLPTTEIGEGETEVDLGDAAPWSVQAAHPGNSSSEKPSGRSPSEDAPIARLEPPSSVDHSPRPERTRPRRVSARLAGNEPTDPHPGKSMAQVALRDEDLPGDGELVTIFGTPDSSAPQSRPGVTSGGIEDLGSPVRTKTDPRRFTTESRNVTGEMALDGATGARTGAEAGHPDPAEGSVASRKPMLPTDQVGIDAPHKAQVADSVQMKGSSKGEWELLYQSSDQRPIFARTIGQGPFRVMVVAGIDGTDRVSVKWAENIAKDIAGNNDLLGRGRFMIVRAVNPDGLVTRTRNNARGIDLNRNFPTRNFDFGVATTSGPYPASEVETRALLQMLSDFRPDRVVIVRSTARRVGTVVHSQSVRPLASKLQQSQGWVAESLQPMDWPGSLEVLTDETLRAQLVALQLPIGEDFTQSYRRYQQGFLQAVAGDAASQGSQPLARNSGLPTLDEAIRNAKKRAAESNAAEPVDVAVDKLPATPTSSNGELPAPPKRRGYEELPPPPNT